jgi:hypothetical protein
MNFSFWGIIDYLLFLDNTFLGGLQCRKSSYNEIMKIKEPKNVVAINAWNEVPNGCYVFEDTYNELYQLFNDDGEPTLHHVGWRYPPSNRQKERGLDPPRRVDFEPNFMYDQPWFREA